MATDKLGLATAARRIFLDDGTEVFTAKEIQRDSEIFISCGENFKDPSKPVKSKSGASLTVFVFDVQCAQTVREHILQESIAIEAQNGEILHTAKLQKRRLYDRCASSAALSQ